MLCLSSSVVRKLNWPTEAHGVIQEPTYHNFQDCALRFLAEVQYRVHQIDVNMLFLCFLGS